MAQRKTLVRLLRGREFRLLRQIRSLKRILVVSDVNIGDSILLQGAVEVLRHYLEDSELDYVCNVLVEDLVAGNPAIDQLYARLTSSTDLADCENDAPVDRLLQQRQYDLIISFCPLLTKRAYRHARCPVITPLGLVLNILEAHHAGTIASLPYQVVRYVEDLIGHLPPDLTSRKSAFEYQGVHIYLDNSGVAQRDAFLRQEAVVPDDRVLFVNPDTSNIYSFIEPSLYANVLRRLLAGGEVDKVLLGYDYTFNGARHHIQEGLPERYRQRVKVLPEEAPLSFYAALVDRADCYLSGDTGPMHIAAARKISGEFPEALRNQTPLVSLFRATEPRIYGYDSYHEEMLSSSQDAPARLVQAGADCRRLSCTIQRVIRTCDAQQCGGLFRAEEVAGFVIDSLKWRMGLRKNELCEASSRRW